MHERTGILEATLFAILLLGLTVGVVSAFVVPDYYELVLSAEDGPLEWSTAIALLLASAICLWRVWTNRHLGTRFVAVMTMAGLILFFGAGEEISWGQRVLGWSSGEFWQEHNAQAETNLHNLMVGDVKVNRILFGVVLTLALFVYFIVVPFLAARFSRLNDFFAHWHIPLPRPRQSAMFFLSVVAMSVIPGSRAPELGEFALGLLLTMVVVNPSNKDEIL